MILMFQDIIYDTFKHKESSYMKSNLLRFPPYDHVP